MTEQVNTLRGIDDWTIWTAREMAEGQYMGDTDKGRTKEDCADDLVVANLGELAVRDYLSDAGYDYRPYDGWEHDGILVRNTGDELSVEVKTRKGWDYDGVPDVLLRGSYQADSDIYIQVVLHGQGPQDVKCADVRGYLTRGDVEEHEEWIEYLHKPLVSHEHLRSMEHLSVPLSMYDEWSCHCSECKMEISRESRESLEVEVQAHYEVNHFDGFSELERDLEDGKSALSSPYVYALEQPA